MTYRSKCAWLFGRLTRLLKSENKAGCTNKLRTMRFSFLEEITIVVRQWKVTSISGLSGSLIAVFSLAVLYEFLNSYHSYLDTPFSKRNIAQDPSTTKCRRMQVHVLRTVSYVLTALAGYLLMLVVGRCDVWLFTSIVSGATFGYFLSNPLYTWYNSIEFRKLGRKDQRNNNRPPHIFRS